MKPNKESVLLIQDIFPVIEQYIDRAYCLDGIPYHLMNEVLKKQIKIKANKILALTRKGIKFNSTQPDIFEIERQLIDKLHWKRWLLDYHINQKIEWDKVF